MTARRSQYVDEVAVERACRGDRTVPLNRAEMLAAWRWLEAHGRSSRDIAATLGVSARAVVRWRCGGVPMARTQIAARQERAS